jgi:CheY-like chemotaxis protein
MESVKMSSHKAQTELLQRLTKQPVLVVHSQRILRTSVRSVLRAIGGSSVHAMSSYAEALEALSVRNFSYILFENAKERVALPAEFARKARALSPNSYLIAMFEPAYLEDLFSCLQAGVRGFVVIPCTPEALEETLLKATEGLNIPPAMLEAESWNVIFARFVLKQLDNLCTVVRRSREEKALVAEVQSQMQGLKEAVTMGKAYCENGDQGFMQEIFSQCINRGEDHKTRLSKVRQQLAKERMAAGKTDDGKTTS